MLHAMRIDWHDLKTEHAARLHGVTVDIEGWIATDDPAAARDHFALMGEPSCCVACLPRDPFARIEVFAAAPMGGSALPSYARLPALAAALMARGFNAADMRKLLGGNYLRVALANLT